MERKYKLPKHVSLPNWDAFEVRIWRAEKIYYKSFPFPQYATVQNALDAAVEWRDFILKGIRGSDPNGVKRSTYSKREREYLRFVVLWADHNGSSRTKTFTVGAVDKIDERDIEHASKTAEAFRIEWEFCNEKGLPFNDEKYANWKSTSTYPFDPDVI